MNILSTAGSSLGYTHTAESKLKMSELKAGELNSMFNKKQLEETKKAISYENTGRSPTNRGN